VTVRSQIEIPTWTIVKVALAVTTVWLITRLWDQILLLFIAVLIAAALEPAAEWLEQRGWSRGRSVLTLLGAFVGVVGLLFVLLVPPLVDQGTRLAENMPGYVEDVRGLLDDYPWAQNWLQDNADQGAADPSAILDGVVTFGTGIFSGIANLFILLALTTYLLLDGDRVFAWLTQPLTPSRRERAARVRVEIRRVVGGYVRGQLITSASFGIFTFVTLSLAGVPQPLLLAVLAALLDAVPLIGATVATVPAVLLGLTVSLPTALVVLVLFLVYQQVENYLIAPRAFRNTLQISSLAVLIAVTVGSALLGIIGALLALPVAAAIPAIARVWGKDLPGEPPAPWPSPVEPEGADETPSATPS
jgi:predicted PurR-regulated permease PerM